MPYIGSRDFLVEVAKGNIPGHTIVHKYGRNDAVPTSGGRDTAMGLHRKYLLILNFFW